MNELTNFKKRKYENHFLNNLFKNEEKKNCEETKNIFNIDNSKNKKINLNQKLYPFWNKHSDKITDYLPYNYNVKFNNNHTKYFNKSSKQLMDNSWFCVKNAYLKLENNEDWVKTTFSSLKHIPPDAEDSKMKEYTEINTDEDEDIESDSSDDEEDIKSNNSNDEDNNIENKAKVKKIYPPMKVIKYRVYPTQKQRKILKSWFDVARWTYNQCVNYIRNTKKSQYSKTELTRKLVNNGNFEAPNECKPWVTKVPFDIRSGAIYDIVKAMDAHKAKKKENKTGFFLHYRSRIRNPVQSIAIPKKHWGRTRGMYSEVLGQDILKTSKHSKLPEKLPYDSRLIIDKLQRYYLCVPQLIVVKPFNKTPLASIVSIDPGVRTFITTYDTQGHISEWGHYDNKHIMRMAIHIDKLISLKASKNTKHRKRYKLIKAIQRMRNRLRNRIDEVHKKSSRWLCENYNNIILPVFSSKSMVKKQDRRIGCKTVRQMLSWSHYRFQQRLQHKVREYPLCNLILTTEEYTSKTCGCCGEIKTNLGSKKEFICTKCFFVMDRDHNGARNVMIKYLTSLLQN